MQQETADDNNNIIFVIITVLGEGLTANFAEATIEMADCPNFNGSPYNFYREGTYRQKRTIQSIFGLSPNLISLTMFSGLCGNPIILDVGGPSYLLPTVQRDKFYDVKLLLQQLNYNHDTLVIGAGAGPWPLTGCNCEVCIHK